MNTNRWTWVYTVALLVVAGLFAAYAMYPIFLDRREPSSNITTWIIFAALMAIFMAIVGYGIMGRFLGILIDERNVMSLSRFQMVLWTLVLLPAWFAAATWNAGVPGRTDQKLGPLDIAMPAQVWALLGISTASLVATPLILKEKTKKKTTTKQKVKSLRSIAAREGKQASLAPLTPSVASEAMATMTPEARMAAQTPTEASVQETAAAVGVDLKGQLFTRTDPADANVSDMFHGDEIGNAAQVDLSKIQMFFFTLILVMAYALAIDTALTVGFDPTKPVLTFGVHQFPAIDPGMAALLAISHAGYLGYKAASHTEDAPDTE